MLERLKERVYRETLKLREYGLAVPTGGSVSGIDREKGLVVIRPGGVSCGELTSADMLVVDLIDGRVAEGKHRPPIDTPTHLYLYRAFPGIGGLVHTRSVNAAAWAQAGKDLPVYGATQADAFCGAVPCTRALTEKEVKGTYELNVGKVIEETFEGKDAALIPAALVPASVRSWTAHACCRGYARLWFLAPAGRTLTRYTSLHAPLERTCRTVPGWK